MVSVEGDDVIVLVVMIICVVAQFVTGKMVRNQLHEHIKGFNVLTCVIVQCVKDIQDKMPY